MIRQHPETFGHLGEPLLDEAELSLHFDVRDPAYRPHERIGTPTARWHLGLFFQFIPDASTQPLSPDSPAPAWHWPLTDVAFYWTWMWTGAGWTGTLQEEVTAAAIKSQPGLQALESQAARAMLADRSGSPFVHRGAAGLEITIEASRTADGRVLIKVFQANRGHGEISLGPATCEFLVNGAAQPSPARLTPNTGHWRSPFRTLQPGQTEEVASHALNVLPVGGNRIRLVWSHPHAGYIDLSPMALDGLPEFRKLDKAWVGVAVSNELTITQSP